MLGEPKHAVILYSAKKSHHSCTRRYGYVFLTSAPNTSANSMEGSFPCSQSCTCSLRGKRLQGQKDKMFSLRRAYHSNSVLIL